MKVFSFVRVSWFFVAKNAWCVLDLVLFCIKMEANFFQKQREIIFKIYVLINELN